jgi:hypothetical protein
VEQALETVVELLNRPALARVYVYICYWGPVAPSEIMEALDLSKSTTYEYVPIVITPTVLLTFETRLS